MEAAVELLTIVSANQDAEEPAGYERIHLHHARREVHPRLPRSLHLVDQSLRDLFGKLCNGKVPWPLLIFGPAGTGKTAAALCLADIAGFQYGTLDDIADLTMAGQWREADQSGCKLIIDEIGTRQRNGDLHYSCLKRCLDDAEFRRNRVGVYVSNLTPSEIASMFDDRIASRLTCGTVFRLAGRDRRHQGGAR